MPTEPGTKTERDEVGSTERLEDAAPADPGTRKANVETPRPGTIGRFRLVAPLGSGGMADVYRAHDPLLDRDVALKVLRTRGTGDDPQRMRRVLREARAAAALTHPNTVTIFDVGEADGEVFIAMELLEGTVLRGALDRGDVPLERKLTWLLQAARALAAAHERGLVHRDVKPDNMFVCADGALKLLDFGIAKRDEDDSYDGPPNSMGPSSLRTAEGRRVGTPRYMAPEQHAGQATDARTDEYAWGLVAFELLTGVHPASALADADGPTLVTALRTKVPELREEIAATIARALARSKEDRFSSMVPIVETLARATTDGTDSASRTKRRGARTWLALAVVTLAAVVLATGARSALRSRAAGRALTADRAASLAPLQVCRVEPARSLPLGPDDRVAVMPDGELATARDIKQQLVLTHETPSGPVPFTSNKVATMLLSGVAFSDLAMLGVAGQGKGWLLLKFAPTDDADSMIMALTTKNDFVGHKLPPVGVSGIAATSFGKDVILGVTSRVIEGRSAGAQIHVLTDFRSSPLVVEGGAAFAPAIATREKLIAFAYLVDQAGRPVLHLALLDENVQRLGNVQSIALTSTLVVPAVAFAGENVVVFWIDNSATTARLTRATLAPGQASPMGPAVALDEAVTLQPPVTARLPSGQWVVAWVATTGGVPTLRMSPIGAGGLLATPTDIAKLPSFSALQATSGDRGVELSWLENGARVAKFARVACDPPR